MRYRTVQNISRYIQTQLNWKGHMKMTNELPALMGHPDSEMLTNIVNRWGTPVMVYDEDAIRARIQEYISGFQTDLFNTRVLYASKAFLCSRMARIALQEGMHFDAVSGGEIHCLAKAGIPAEKIYFHGNNKTLREISDFFRLGRGHIVIDNEDELSLIHRISRQIRSHMDILIRVNPGVEAHTHQYIATATKDSKFGISTERAKPIAAMIEFIDQSAYLHFQGFHSHIGSQIFESGAFDTEISVMFDFIENMNSNYGVEIHELDLGGGFAIRYTPQQQPPNIKIICRNIIRRCTLEMDNRNLHIDTLIIEPGRSIAGDAGYTLYTAGCRKETDSKEFLFVDGGMTDNIRPALYNAEYTCTNISRPLAPITRRYSIAGKCCESGDILLENAPMPETFPGDLLLFHSTGAYSYSMASCYNRLGRPPVVFIAKGKAECVIRRETYDDMMSLEVV